MTTAKYLLLGIRHTYIEINNAGTLSYKRVYLSNKCDIKVSNAKLEYSGDGMKIQKNYGYQANGTVEVDSDDDSIDGILWNTPAVAPQAGDDFAQRYFRGTDAELQSVYVGLRISLDAENVDTGAPAVFRYRILKVTFDPDAPSSFASEAKAGRLLSWNGYRALTDISGAALTGIPARGAFWMKEIITNSAAFDPVAGDIL